MPDLTPVTILEIIGFIFAAWFALQVALAYFE